MLEFLINFNLYREVIIWFKTVGIYCGSASTHKHAHQVVAALSELEEMEREREKEKKSFFTSQQGTTKLLYADNSRAKTQKLDHIKPAGFRSRLSQSKYLASMLSLLASHFQEEETNERAIHKELRERKTLNSSFTSSCCGHLHCYHHIDTTTTT